MTVLGAVGVTAMTRQECVRVVFDLPREPVSASVALVGVPAAVLGRESARMAKLYNGATLAAIDGMPLVKKARRSGLACERCAGPDIMGPIFSEGLKRGSTHYFYGGKDETIVRRLRESLERDYPGIRILGMYCPPFRPLTDEEDAAVCREINDLTPDFVWVGIGAPKQEMWIEEHVQKIHGCVMLGVGAAFDFFAGTLDKAPEWVENAGLEWIFRLIKEPRRLWRRYIVGGAKYVFYTLLDRLGLNPKDKSAAL